MDSLIVGEDKVRLVGFPQNGIVKWRKNADQVLVQHNDGSSDSFLQLKSEKFVDFGEMTHGTCSRNFDLCEKGIIILYYSLVIMKFLINYIVNVFHKIVGDFQHLKVLFWITIFPDH